MDSNRDDATRCLDMASKALESGDLDKATRLLEKSQRMFPQLSDAQVRLNAAIQLARASSSSSSKKKKHAASSSPTSSASSAFNTNGQSSTSDTADGSSSSSAHNATPAMKTAVQRIQKLSKESHYKVLAIEKEADEAAIKKAYRRLALQLHPDRNAAKGADEAFKRVSAAFVVLSDSSKRDHYDQFGTDPDAPPTMSRNANGFPMNGDGSNVFMNGVPLDQFFQTNGGGVSADDLLNMFLNGGGGGGVRFNSNGVRFTHARQRRRHTTPTANGHHHTGERQHAGDGVETEQSPWERIKPMVWMVLFMFLSYWVSGTDDAYGRTPSFSLQRSRYNSVGRQTGNSVTFYTHGNSKLNERDERKLWRSVDGHALTQFKLACEVEEDEERDLLYRSRSWLAGQKSRDKYKRTLQQFRKPWCIEYERLVHSIRRNS